MNKGELLDYLAEQARVMLKDKTIFERNMRMHGLALPPSDEDITGVLTMFINQVGYSQGLDYGLYAKDLADSVLTLGGFLRRARRSKDLSLRELAKQADILPSRLSWIEIDDVKPTMQELSRLGEILEVEVAVENS